MGRCDFGDETLHEVLPAEPFGLVVDWMRLAADQKSQPNPNAMTLATVDSAGVPSVRVVLARGVDPQRGFVTFYTNYRSAKGKAIGASATRAPAAPLSAPRGKPSAPRAARPEPASRWASSGTGWTARSASAGERRYPPRTRATRTSTSAPSPRGSRPGRATRASRSPRAPGSCARTRRRSGALDTSPA